MWSHTVVLSHCFFCLLLFIMVAKTTYWFGNSCRCTSTALDMPEWRETTEQTDWRAKQPSQAAYVSEDMKCWGLETLPAGTKPGTSHHRSPGGERRGTRKRYHPWKDERGLNQTNVGTVSKATLAKLLGDEVERIWAFPGAWYIILTWTELGLRVVHPLFARR